MNTEHEKMTAGLRRYGIKDERVLEAMRKVRRHVYIPDACRADSDPYGDHPCPIGFGQTISQPYIVAYMTQRIAVTPGDRILEIGTGAGYQAAVLAELGATVYGVELIPELADHARAALAVEGYGEVRVKTGDGYEGWLEHAPFDSIILACAPNEIPSKVVEQLKDGGCMVLPVGSSVQRLVVLEKVGSSCRETPDLYVRFVPMLKGRG
jgi:protein-L-isoaspartate(D-aspartate) O-methyltransferase